MCSYYGRTETSWRYGQLMKLLELRQHEVEQLSQDFENKIRAKEVILTNVEQAVHLLYTIILWNEKFIFMVLIHY